MKEIYWLTRLGAIGTTCDVLACLGIVVLVVGGCILFACHDLFFDDGEIKKYMKAIKIFFAVWMVSILGAFFIPGTKELMAIYGIGTTIDYIKSNDKAKELPDKAVDALTRYLDNIENETK